LRYSRLVNLARKAVGKPLPELDEKALVARRVRRRARH
jgi:hypothetical protein